MRNAFTLILTAFSLATAAACVTVNVNFPESAVQEATDDYVRDLYKAKEKGTSASPTPAGAKSSLSFSLFPAAHAAEIPTQFTVKSAKAIMIRDRLAELVDDVLAQKRAGVLGEGNDGMLVLKAPEKLKKLLLTKVEKLVTEENALRDELYDEVVASNSLAPARRIDVTKSFARSFQNESPAGTWIQAADGTWAQKK